MSVNVYGRTQAKSADNNIKPSVVSLDLSGKVSRDGSLAMLGDLEMGNFNIKGLKEPTLDNDASTKFYIDKSINAKVSRDGSLPMNGNLNMNDFRIRGLKIPELDTDASTKSYVDSANSGKLSRDGSLGMTGNLIMGNFNIKALKEPVLGKDASTKSYVDKANSTKISRDGSIPMNGDLNMGNFNIKELKEPELGTDASTKSYVDKANSANNVVIASELGGKVSRDGSLAMIGDLNMNNFGIKGLKEPVLGSDASTKNYVDSVKVSSNGSITITKDLDMDNFNIKRLKEPVLGSDASTKNYADNANKFKKCHVGYIPNLTANIGHKNGFTPSASSEPNATYLSYNAFNTEGNEWRVGDITTNFWIRIQCPEQVRIWRFALRGGHFTTDRIFNWRFEGSNDNVSYDILYSAARVHIGYNLQMFNISPVNSYSYYRLFTLEANGINSGLSYFQIFVYSD